MSGAKRGGQCLYLTKFGYTPETWARLIMKPEDRRRATERHIGAVGGTLHGFWYAFGETALAHNS